MWYTIILNLLDALEKKDLQVFRDTMLQPRTFRFKNPFVMFFFNVKNTIPSA